MRQPVLYPPHFQIVLILGTQPKGPLLLEALPDSLLIPLRSVWEVLGQVGCMGLTHSHCLLRWQGYVWDTFALSS